MSQDVRNGLFSLEGSLMGSSITYIVAHPSSTEGLSRLAEKVKAILIFDKVILPTPSDGDSGESPSYPPGSGYEKAFTEKPKSVFNEIGFELRDELSVFDAGEDGMNPFCPGCSSEIPVDDRWMAALDELTAGKGPGKVECGRCGKSTGVDGRRYDPPIAFGRFAIAAWNAPDVRDEWLEELKKRIGCPFSVVFSYS